MIFLPINIGVVGTGFGAQVHVPGFLGMDGVRLVGIAGRNTRRTEEIAVRYGIHPFPSWEALIDSPAIDAVAIAVPGPLQAAIAQRCIAAGKSVLCEKPLAANAAEACSLLHAARKAGIVHAVDFEYRELGAFHAAFQHLRADSDDVRQVTVRWRANTWANPQRPWSWKCDKNSGGGVLTALVIHVIDYLPWLLQRAIRSVSSTLEIDIPKRPGPSGLVPATAETTCKAQLTLEGGCIANIDVSNTASDTLGHHIELQTDKRTLVIHSDNLQDYARDFSLHAIENDNSTLLQAPNDPPASEDGRIVLFKALATRFLRAIRSGDSAGLPDFLDGWRAQTAVDALREANDHQRTVDISATET